MCSVDRIMYFNRVEPTCYGLFFLTPVPANKMQLFIHITTPYIHQRLDSESRIGPKFSD